MKQKDIALVIAIIGVAAFASFLLFSVLFGKATNAKISVEVVSEIEPDFILPSEKYFNNQALNPTEVITIAPDGNTDPFKNAQ